MPAGAARARRQLVHNVKVCPLHPLYDKLSDPVTADDPGRLHRIVVDQVDHDLAAVAGVDRARRVEHRDAEPRGQTRSRVHQSHVTRAASAIATPVGTSARPPGGSSTSTAA